MNDKPVWSSGIGVFNGLLQRLEVKQLHWIVRLAAVMYTKVPFRIPIQPYIVESDSMSQDYDKLEYFGL